MSCKDGKGAELGVDRLSRRGAQALKESPMPWDARNPRRPGWSGNPLRTRFDVASSLTTTRSTMSHVTRQSTAPHSHPLRVCNQLGGLMARRTSDITKEALDPRPWRSEMERASARDEEDKRRGERHEGAGTHAHRPRERPRQRRHRPQRAVEQRWKDEGNEAEILAPDISDQPVAEDGG